MNGNAEGVAGLTARQREILRLVARNMQAKEIARELGISERTVKTHTDAARRRLGVASTREAARLLADYERQSGERGHGVISGHPDSESDTGDTVPEGHRPSRTMDVAAAPASSSPRTAEPARERAGGGLQGLEARLAEISPMGWLGLILLTAVASALVAAGLLGGVLGLLDGVHRLSAVLPD